MYKRNIRDYRFLWNSWQTCFSFPCEILSGCFFLHSPLLNAPLSLWFLFFFSVALTCQLKENVKEQLTPVKCPLCHSSTKSGEWWRGFCTGSVGIVWLILAPISDISLYSTKAMHACIYILTCVYIYIILVLLNIGLQSRNLDLHFYVENFYWIHW